MLPPRAKTALHAAGALAGMLALISITPTAAAASEYTIAPVVKSVPNGMQVTGSAALADDGSVVFGGVTQLPPDPPDPNDPPFPPPQPRFRSGIYRLRGGAVTPLYETNGAPEILRLATNRLGDVAFYSQAGNEERYYRIPAAGGVPVLVAADTVAGGAYDTLRMYPNRLLLGEDGRVVFPATIPDTVPPATTWQQLYGIFDGPSPTANRVITNDSPIGTPQLQFIRPDGTVLVRGSGGTAPMGIYKGTNPAADLVMDLSRHNNPSGYVENASGQAAFTAFIPDGQGGGLSGVFTGPDPVLHLLADSSGAYDAFDTTPHIADDGTVIFSATLDAGGRGIFTGPDAVADKIIATGDSLFGSTVTYARTYLGESSIDSVDGRGNVLFVYTLANGERGLALATPVPEPVGASLLVLGAAACLRRRRT